MHDFKPVTAGQATIEFTPEAGGPPTALTGPKPSRPGAFRVEGAAARCGTLSLGAACSTRQDSRTATISARSRCSPTKRRHAPKRPAQPPDDPAAIAYLKEQQWTNEFATAPVQEAEVRTSIRVPAMVDALPGGEAIVSAPAPGRFLADTLPDVGDRVTRGAGPRTPGAEADGRQRSRDARLGRGGGSGRARRRARGTDARRTPAGRESRARAPCGRGQARRRRSLKPVCARPRRDSPSGTKPCGAVAARRRATPSSCAPQSPDAIVDVMATLGASYDEGAALFKIARTDAVELRADVPAADAARARGV